MAIRAIEPSLNHNEGRHELPLCYDYIFHQVSKKPKPPTPHSPTKPLPSTEKGGPGRLRTPSRNSSRNCLEKSRRDEVPSVFLSPAEKNGFPFVLRGVWASWCIFRAEWDYA